MLWRQQKERKYFAVRQGAFRVSEARLPQLIMAVQPYLVGTPITLQTIDAVALKEWETRWLPNLRGPVAGHDWNWRQERAGYDRSQDRFEVAVWSAGELCGLGIGKPSNSYSCLAVNLLQGSPVLNHPLKGAIRHIIVDAAIAYAEALKIKELRLRNLPKERCRYTEICSFSLRSLRDSHHIVF